MRTPIARPFTAGAVLALLLSGCTTAPTPFATDEEALLSLIEQEADFFTADLFGDAGDEEPAPPARGVTEINPLRFGRQITDRDRTITIEIDDQTLPATAVVTWTVQMEGLFLVMDDQLVRHEKPLQAEAVRSALFEQRGDRSTRHRGWRLLSISGTRIASTPATVDILSVHFASTSGVDALITDIASLTDRETILAFPPLDTVTVTITTSNTDDVVLLHHPAWQMHDAGRHHLRRLAFNNGDGTYTVHGLRHANGPRHVTIDVLGRQSVHTDDGPYDSEAWSVPFSVRLLPE
jgi:hypothetical protein